MRISDCSSDVCSSDLPRGAWHGAHRIHAGSFHVASQTPSCDSMRLRYLAENDTQGAMIKFSAGSPPLVMGRERTSVVEGQSVSVSVDLGGSRSIKKNNTSEEENT